MTLARNDTFANRERNEEMVPEPEQEDIAPHYEKFFHEPIRKLVNM